MRTKGIQSLQKAGLMAVVGVLLLGLLPLVIETAEAESLSEMESPGSIEFVGKNAFVTANGRFHTWRVVESEVDLAALSESFALIEVDLSSIDTGINRRDNHLRNPDFFDVERYPVAVARVHSARPKGETEAGRPLFLARFDIDLHGVQKTVEGEVVLLDEDPLAFEGSLAIDRMEFGVGKAPNRWNPMSVKAEIQLHFRVEL